MKDEMMRTLDYKNLMISSTGRDYVIKAKAKNWIKTEVIVSSNDRKKQKK